FDVSSRPIFYAVIVAVVLTGVGWAADSDGNGFLLQSPGYGHPADIDAWRQQEQRDGLKPYPPAPPGVPNPPGGLFQFGGSGRSSFGSPDLGSTFADWQASMR